MELEYGEQCDNGGQIGCIGCVVDSRFSCVGDAGGPSTCIKIPVCGDNWLDVGE
jgi:hypothetical protein